MKRRIWAMAAAAVLGVSLLSGCGEGGPDAPPAAEVEEDGASGGNYDLSQVEERIYVLGHSGSAGSTNDFWGLTFAELVEEKSGGKMTVEVYNASQLGSDTSIAADVQANSVDFQITSPAAIPNVVKESAVFDMPFLFDTVEEAREAVMDDAVFDGLTDAFEAQGLKLFPLTDQGFRCITTNKEITGADSFRGMSLRTMNNPYQIAWFTAMGVAATPLNTSEIYLALQQGMLDGQENPWSQVYDKGLYDVQKYVTNSNHVLYVGCMFMGTGNWNELSSVERQIIWDAAQECVPIVQEYTDSYENEMLQKLINEYGMIYVDFDQIPGLREQLREETFDVAYESITGAIGNELLDQLLTVAGYGDMIPQ